MSNIPSNVEIKETLDSVKEGVAEAKKEQQLDQTGRKIVEQTEKLIEDTKRFVFEKNPNDLIQQMVAEGQQFSASLQGNRQRWQELSKVADEFPTEELRKKSQQFAKTIQLVSLELMTSESFREAVWDFLALLYNVLVDASGVRERLGEPLRNSWEGRGVDRRESFKRLVEEGVRYAIDVADEERQVVKLSRDQVDLLVEYFSHIVQEINSRERSQRAARHLMDIFHLFRQPTQSLTAEASRAATEIVQDPHLNRLGQLGQQLFGNLIGQDKVGALFDHIKAIFNITLKDEELDRYFKDLERLFNELIDDPQKVGDETTRRQIEDYINRGRDLVNQRQDIRRHFWGITNESLQIMDRLANDPSALRLQEDIHQLARLLFLDESGNVVFKPDALQQLRIVLTTAVLRRLRLPLPTIEYDDGTSLAFALSGVIMDVQSLLPDRVIAEHRGIAVVDTKDLRPEVQRATQSFALKMENINIHIPEADIWFHRKTFPSVEDAGVVRLNIGGRGLDVLILFNATAQADRVFTLEKVDCTIHDLDMKLSQTHHDIIYNAIITVFKPLIKGRLEGVIEDSISSTFETLNHQLRSQISQLPTLQAPSLSSVTQQAAQLLQPTTRTE